MKPSFDISVIDFEVLKEIEGTWLTEDFISLLENMEFGETSELNDNDLVEMTLMALQDLEPTEAAQLVLTQHLGDRLTKGQILNSAHEMLDEKLWEEYADVELHEGMFNVASLLYRAFPRMFPEPDAVRVTLEVTATNKAGEEILAGDLNEPFLVRLLADGMDSNAILHRLFEEQLQGGSFPEAENIVWIWSVNTEAPPRISIQLISSGYWLDQLRDTKNYSSSINVDV